MNHRDKKKLGNWGEKTLDVWMKQLNWEPISKNLRIKNGEIDRIYLNRGKKTHQINICVAEIKTALFYKISDVERLFTEIGIKCFLKQRQIRNLYRCGENILALMKSQTCSQFHIFLRLFIIFKGPCSLSKMSIVRFPQSPAFKVCHKGENYFIFSIEPEFTTITARKSLLQVKI